MTLSICHASRLESLAELHDRNPLHILEWFLSCADLHEREGLSRAEAERLAVLDIEAELGS